MKKTIAAATAAAAAVGGVAVGATIAAGPAVSAQVPDETEETAPLVEDLVERAIRDALSGLVDDGVITGEQADAVAQELAANRRFDGRQRGEKFGRGFGFGVAGELTELLGLETTEVMERLMDGESLAEIAEAQGVDPDAIAELLVSEAEARLDAAVERGFIDADEAEEKLAELDEMIDDLVSGELPGRGFGGRGFGADRSTGSS